MSIASEQKGLPGQDEGSVDQPADLEIVVRWLMLHPTEQMRGSLGFHEKTQSYADR
jgi:hypothetical protein